MEQYDCDKFTTPQKKKDCDSIALNHNEIEKKKNYSELSFFHLILCYIRNLLVSIIQ